MQYEKQRKEHKLQAMKVGFSQDDGCACHMIMVFDLSLWLQSVFIFEKEKKSLNLVCCHYPNCCSCLFCFLQKIANNNIILQKCTKTQKLRCQTFYFSKFCSWYQFEQILTSKHKYAFIFQEFCVSFFIPFCPLISFTIMIFIKNLFTVFIYLSLCFISGWHDLNIFFFLFHLCLLP